MALGGEGFKPSHLRVNQPVKVAYGSISLRSLNHATSQKSMGLEPKSRIVAFAGKWDLAIIQLTKSRSHDLWLVSRRGPTKFARIAALSELIKGAANTLG